MTPNKRLHPTAGPSNLASECGPRVSRGADGQEALGDRLVRRFAGLAPVPTARTVSNWLRRFTQ